MKHGGQAPDHDGYGVAQFGTNPVDQPAKGQQTECVGGLKRHHHRAVVRFSPAKLRFEGGFEQPDYLPVEVVDGSGKK